MVLEKILGMRTFPEEPVQTRKRKKAAGCNLRKSLAWNQSFFTEEGVLNPQELSILSGSFSGLSKNFLSGNNEGEVSVVVGSSFHDTSDLQALEENLFKELPVSSQNKDQKLGGLSSTSQSSTQEDPPQSRSSRKVHLAKGINKSVAQGGGCPGSSASYSQKRLTHTNARHEKNVMCKVPKLPVPKIDSSLLPLLPKNATPAVNRSNCYQNGLPVNAEKNLKHSSGNAKKAAICITSSAKSLETCSGKHVANQSSKMPLSASLWTQEVGKGTVDLKVVPDPILVAADMHASAGHADSSKAEVSLPRYDCFNFGTNLSAKYHPKPSGLRMPSPSLGYFCQAKFTAPRTIPSQKMTQPCDLSGSCNRTLGKPDNMNHIGELNLPYATTGRPPKMGSCTAITGTIGAATPVTQPVSRLKGLIPSIETLALHPTQKPTLEPKEVERKRVKDSYYKTNSQELLHGDCSGVSDSIEEQTWKQDLRMPEPGEIKKISQQENGKLRMSDVTLESGCSEQLQRSNGFESNDIPLNRDSRKFELLNPYPSQLSSPKQIKLGISGVNSDINHRHAEAAVSETFFGKYHRPTNSDQPQESNDFMSNTTINNIHQSTSVEAQSTLRSSKEHAAGAGITRHFGSVASSSEEIHSPYQAVSQLQQSILVGDDNGLMSDLLPKETRNALSGYGKQPDDGGFQLDNDMIPTKDEVATMPTRKGLVDYSKKDHAPFSNEWLSARVAAGEDILSLKTGAVQNSPPDKSIPEPGPWSPVKRNAQEIGPFDCTKYTDLSLSNPR